MIRKIYDVALPFIVCLGIAMFALLYVTLTQPNLNTEITISPEGNMTVIEYQNNEIIKYNGLEVK